MLLTLLNMSFCCGIYTATLQLLQQPLQLQTYKLSTSKRWITLEHCQRETQFLHRLFWEYRCCALAVVFISSARERERESSALLCKLTPRRCTKVLVRPYCVHQTHNVPLKSGINKVIHPTRESTDPKLIKQRARGSSWNNARVMISNSHTTSSA